MSKFKRAALEAVVSQLVAMYENNVLGENGNETFAGWCEDGAVFNCLECRDECIELMKQLAPHVDALTNAIVGIEENGGCEPAGMTATELLSWIEEHKRDVLKHFEWDEIFVHGNYLTDEVLESMYQDVHTFLHSDICKDTIYQGNTPTECLSSVCDDSMYKLYKLRKKLSE